jgi:hypothetical protein
MIEPTTRVKRNSRVAFRKLADEEGGVLLLLDTAQYHGVNPIGALIWELAEPAPSFDALVASIEAKLEDPPADLSSDVEEFLEDLAERGLVELGEGDEDSREATAGP